MRDYKIEEDFYIDGYRCLVVGQSLGHRCGYVGIPKEHPFYGKDYDTIPVQVHGGLTWCSDGREGYPAKDNVWWIGFDCAHSIDSRDFELIKELASPVEYEAMKHIEEMFPTLRDGVIRTKEFVHEELVFLVEQIKEYER